MVPSQGATLPDGADASIGDRFALSAVDGFVCLFVFLCLSPRCVVVFTGRGYYVQAACQNSWARMPFPKISLQGRWASTFWGKKTARFNALCGCVDVLDVKIGLSSEPCYVSCIHTPGIQSLFSPVFFFSMSLRRLLNVLFMS